MEPTEPTHSTPQSITRSQMRSPELSEISTSTTVQQASASIAPELEPPESLETSVTQGLSSLTLQNNSHSDSDVPVSPNKQRKVANTGRDWKYFKPMQKLSLYSQILMEPESVQNSAVLWSNKVRANEDVASLFLLQLFVDVAGYQDFDISRINGNDVDRFKKIVEYMDKHPSAVLCKYTYLLHTSSNWSRKARAAIFGFIENLVESSDGNAMLYRSEVFPEALGFLKLMSGSQIRAVKHSGVVVALKFLVSLANVLKNVEEQLCVLKQEFIHGSHDTGRFNKAITQVTVKREMLIRYVEYLFKVLVKNYSYNDPELDDMRVACAEVTFKLMTLVPDKFFNPECISMLLKLLIDESDKVRASVVTAFKKLFKMNKYAAYLEEEKVTRILEEICKTTLDINLDVAAEAIDVITCALKNYPGLLSRHVTDTVFRLVYNKHYKIAAPAGKFLMTYIRASQAEVSPSGTLKKLVHFHHMPGMRGITAFLVEAIIDCTPELQSFDTIGSLLLSGELQSNNELILMEIFRHTVAQILTGKTSIAPRREGEVDPEKNRQITHLLIPIVCRLFVEFANKKDCLKNLLEILLAFDYRDKMLAQYRNDFKRLFGILREVYFKTKDKEVLELMVRFLVQVNEDFCPLKSQAVVEKDNLAERTICTFHTLIGDGSEAEFSKEEIATMEITYAGISSLYQHLDLSQYGLSWRFGLPQKLFVLLQEQHVKILTYDLECGQYSLIWELRTLLDTNLRKISHETEMQIDHLKSDCDEYLRMCFYHLKHSRFKSLEAQAFWCICDLHQQFCAELEAPIACNGAWNSIMFQFRDQPEETCLLEFLKKNVLNMSVDCSFGCKYLGKFLDTVMLSKKDTFQISMLYMVFGYYHQLYKRYEKHFNLTLKSFQEMGKSVFEGFVVVALTNAYEALEERNNLSSEEAVNLRKLTVQFQLYAQATQRKRMLMMCVKFAASSKHRLSFLRYVRSLCDGLSASERSDVLKYCTCLSRYNDNGHVLFFIDRLKVNRSGRRYVSAPVIGQRASETSQSEASCKTESEDLDSDVSERMEVDSVTIEDESD